LHKTEQLRHKTQPRQESNTGCVALEVGERQIASEHLGRAVRLHTALSVNRLRQSYQLGRTTTMFRKGSGRSCFLALLVCLTEGAFAYPGPLPGTEDLPKMADWVLVCKGK